MRTSMCVVSLLVFSSFAHAQNSIAQPAPASPASVLGPQLIAWSELQKPQPIPHFVQPAQPDSSVRVQQSAEPQRRPIQSSGTIAKDGKTCILKISGADSLQIEDVEQARPYEGKQVAITGSLDQKTNSLQVTSIELLP